MSPSDDWYGWRVLTRLVEVTDFVAYGKFCVCRVDPKELATESEMPDAKELLGRVPTVFDYSGRRRLNDHSTLVIDLQRGTGFAWPLTGGAAGMQHYRTEHFRSIEFLVCPLYLPFVLWLHLAGIWAMGGSTLDDIPRYLELPIAFGYRDKEDGALLRTRDLQDPPGTV